MKRASIRRMGLSLTPGTTERACLSRVAPNSSHFDLSVSTGAGNGAGVGGWLRADPICSGTSMSSNCVVELGQHIERNQRNILRQAHIRPNVSRTSGKSRANIPERAGLTFPRVLESLSIRNSSPAHAATGSSQPSTFRTSDTPLDATIHPSQPCVQRVCRDPCANLAGQRPRRGVKCCRRRTRAEPARSNDRPNRAFNRHPNSQARARQEACAGRRWCRRIAPVFRETSK